MKVLKSPFASAATAKKDAKDGYNYVISKTDSSHENDVQLVAALYIASGHGKGIYVSSIPKGPASALMDTADAPAWAHQVAGVLQRQIMLKTAQCGFSKTHSAPSSLTRLSIRMAQVSTFMGISKTTQATQSIPTIQPPCSAFGPTPSCNNVLNNLGITLGN